MAKRIRKRVFIVPTLDGGAIDVAVVQMFKNHKWTIAESLRDSVDLIQFVGGNDVTPKFYNHHRHISTLNSIVRDQREKLIYLVGIKMSIPMAGICRGGQFLNVMCGGTLFQDVKHHRNPHLAFDHIGQITIGVSSTHHQEMIAVQNTNRYKRLMTANPPNGTIKEKLSQLGQIRKIIVVANQQVDTEALLYYDEKCLCFQPHPEYTDKFKECTRMYFKYLDLLLKLT